MDEYLQKALIAALAMIRPNMKAEDALKFSQTALNLSHVKAQFASLDAKAATRKGAGASAS
jgi:hypothetical protein